MTDPAPILYLGPTTPRWQPRTLADIETVIADGTLDERWWIDVKLKVGDTPSAKLELARDVASFANKGGILIIGVSEDKENGRFAVKPQPVAGIPEMIEQVVRSRCDPPVFLQCHPIPDPADPTTGVLIVEIPPSPVAPHQAGGKYFGRGDKTKYVMADAEVSQLHAVRRGNQLIAEDVIDGEISRAPGMEGSQYSGLLFLVARPLASPPDLLTEALATPTRLTPIIDDAHYPSAGNYWRRATEVEPRATGAGWYSRGVRGRQWPPALDIEISDDGAVAVLAGGMTGANLVHTELVIGLVTCAARLAAGLGNKFGYRGQWQLAVGMIGIRGMVADYYKPANAGRIDTEDATSFSAHRYVQGTLASTGELASRPRDVTRRLLLRFVRALGVLDIYDTDQYLRTDDA